MSGELWVWLGGGCVGALRRGGDGGFTFTYGEEWLALSGAPPLSLNLPLRVEPFRDAEARPFFANLLPEAGVRDAVARRLGVSARNDFALLEALGGECAGALTLLPAGERPQEAGEYREIGEEELHALVSSLGRAPLLTGEEGIRLSLAGAQDKLALYVRDDRIFLPVGALPSSHIFKPGMSGYDSTVRNEALTMVLAGSAGLGVPPSRVRRSLDELYEVERYDRVREADGSVRRLHQEDFCQALGIMAENKYEAEGGPSLADCFGLLNRASSPARDKLRLLKWVVFNWLVFNADAHAKNLSLLLSAEGISLSPFYDLLCTGAYPEVSGKLAMKIGGENRPGYIRDDHWRRFADETAIGWKLVRRTIGEVVDGLKAEMAETIAAEEAALGRSPVYDAIRETIARQLRHAEAVLTHWA